MCERNIFRGKIDKQSARAWFDIFRLRWVHTFFWVGLNDVRRRRRRRLRDVSFDTALHVRQKFCAERRRVASRRHRRRRRRRLVVGCRPTE